MNYSRIYVFTWWNRSCRKKTQPNSNRFRQFYRTKEKSSNWNYNRRNPWLSYWIVRYPSRRKKSRCCPADANLCSQNFSTLLVHRSDGEASAVAVLDFYLSYFMLFKRFCLFLYDESTSTNGIYWLNVIVQCVHPVYGSPVHRSIHLPFGMKIWRAGEWLSIGATINQSPR